MAACAQRRDRRHGAVGTIRTRSTTSWAFPNLPRRAGRARDGDQRRDEDRRGARAGGTRARGRARRSGRRPTPRGGLQYGPHYILPKPFDPRLIARLPPAVARAAMGTPGWRGGPSPTSRITATASRRGSTPRRRTCTGSGGSAGAPYAHGVRRGRRGEGHSRGDPVACGGAGRRGADRPRTAHPGDSRGDGPARAPRARSPQRAAQRTPTPATPTSFTNACNAKAISAATASAW